MWDALLLDGQRMFYVAGGYGGNYFNVPVHNVVLGSAAAWPVVWGLLCHSLKTQRHMDGLGLTFFYPGEVVFSLVYIQQSSFFYFSFFLYMFFVFFCCFLSMVNVSITEPFFKEYHVL